MTRIDTPLHNKANGAFFPIVHGMELRRVQQRLLTSLLRQPGLIPTVLTTGISANDFPNEWRHAFFLATKEPGNARQIVADSNGDLTIRQLYVQIVLLGHGQARQMAEQIIISNRQGSVARCVGDQGVAEGTNDLTNGDEEPELSDVDVDGEHVANQYRELNCDHDRQSEDVGSRDNAEPAQQRHDFGTHAEDVGNENGEIVYDHDRLSKDVGSQDNNHSSDADDVRDGRGEGAPEEITGRNSAEQGTVEDQPLDPDLVEMNQIYAVVRVSGKTRVVWFEMGQPI
jgi:hypothetical protein